MALVGLVLAVAAPAARAQTVSEVRIRLTAPGAATDSGISSAPEESAPPPAPPQLSLLARYRRSGVLPKQRSPELSSTHLLVVAESATGEIVDWQLVPDPRLLRAEAPGPAGELEGQVLTRREAEVLVAIPDDPSIVRLRLYHPRWTGKAFTLDFLGHVPLP